jgi:hypothetical protein
MATSLLLGDPSALPFMGHLRMSMDTSDARLSLAGRITSGGDVVEAYEASRNILEHFESLPEPEGGMRNELLRSVWERLTQMGRDQLGRDGGSGLQLLLLAEDDEGMGVAGVGLSMVYGRVNGAWTPLVSEGHPLLCSSGVPETVPGVLTLDAPVDLILGIPDHLGPELRGDFDPVRDCGWSS